MFRRMRRVAVLAGIVALASGAIATAPAHASGSWSVVWNGTALIPSSVPAAVGDSIVFTKQGNGQGDTVAVRNDTGQLRSAAGLCDGGPDCELDQAANLTMSVVALGNVLMQVGGNTVATLSLTGSSGGTGPYTMTFNGNKADACTPASASGPVDAAYRLPAAADCTRTGYKLLGWSQSQTSVKPDDASLTQGTDPEQGAQAAFADSGTLYAVWQPVDGVEITYDSNVGWYMPCVTSAGERVNDDVRWSDRLKAMEVVTNNRVTTKLQPLTDDPIHTAFCKPEWLVLRGWSTSPFDAFGDPDDKALATRAIGLRTKLENSKLGLKKGDRVTLYAMWTLPTVTLHFANSDGPVTFEWESSLSALASSVPEAAPTPTGCQPTWYTVSEPGEAPTGMYMTVRDTLDDPAPYTTVFMGAQNANIALHSFVALSTAAAPRVSGRDGLILATTGSDGYWPVETVAGKPINTAFFMGFQYCPRVNTGSGVSAQPGMWVLTAKANGNFGHVLFDAPVARTR